MILDRLELFRFRSYKKNVFNFSADTNIIVGQNASGKTNLIEAIFFLALGKSFRAENDKEVISFNADLARMTAEVIYDHQERKKLEVMVTKGQVLGIKSSIKKYQVNGVGKKAIDFVGHLKVVLFWPQDLALVTDSPSLRRKYLDFVLIQVDREYRRNLLSYEKGLRQRNKVLEAIREKGAHRHQLIFWDQLLIKTGEYITKKREEYIEYLNQYQELKKDRNFDHYRLEYDRSIISANRLSQYSQEEIAAGSTLVGPHRDDLVFWIQKSNSESRNLSHFGSRGEQRLAVFWLKLGELSYLKKKTSQVPILLLDDIFSELDHEHREIIFDLVGSQQTIMSVTDLHLIEKNKWKNVKWLKI